MLADVLEFGSSSGPTCVRLAKMTSVVIRALLDFFSVLAGSASKTRGDDRRLVGVWLTGRGSITECGLDMGAGLERSVKGTACTWVIVVPIMI